MAAAIADFQGVSTERREGQGLAWHLRQPIVPAAKWALRRYGMATAAQRPGPDFLVIGAKRGGSTSLYRNLVRTPDVLGLYPRRADLKGTYYFDIHFDRGERWYRSHFPRADAHSGAAEDRRSVVGEASPYYLSHPWAAERAAALVPDAKIVVLLRNPVDRAYSHYKERVKQGIETLPTFAAAIEAEDARLAGELEHMLEDPSYRSWNHLNFGYQAQSDYAPALRRWTEHFPSEQVLVLRSEDFYADEGGSLDQIRCFLGLAPVGLRQVEHFNDTGPSDLDQGLVTHLQERFRPGVEALEAATGHRYDWS